MKPAAILTVLLATLAVHAADLIPLPVSVESRAGVAALHPGTRILYAGEHAQAEANMLSSMLRPATGLPLPVARMTAADDSPGDAICLTMDPRREAALGKEGYTLEVIPASGVRITAAAPAGLFYGGQTLRQLLPPVIYATTRQPNVKWEMPACRIEDRPRFGWRGMMLDSSRHFQNKQFILRFLDLMAMHKLNVFHWHLVDDHGWRLEIKKYPKLTSVGAWRKQPEYPQNNGIYGGFYTQDDVREIVAFAARLHITVVPEIEIPGHSQAALAAYPEFSCDGKPGYVEGFYHYPHVSMAGVAAKDLWPPNSCNVFCASNPRTREFLKDVLTETMALFPGQYIHIGGDEVDSKYWAACPRCKAMIADKGWKNFHALQSDLTGEMDRFLNQHGRRMIGWDEILQGGLTPGAAVMSWRGTDGGVKAAKAGHPVVMTPNNFLYFSRAAPTPKGQKLPVFAKPSIPLEAVYQYDPVPAGLSAAQQELILGAEACIWTEKYHTPEWLEMVAFPRLCALAEAIWTPAAAKDLHDFQNRMQTHRKRLDIRQVRSAPDT